MELRKLEYNFRVMVLAAFAIACLSTASWAADYYVNATTGNDTNVGTLSSPWQSLAKVNGFAFKPGDNVYFQSGQSWNAALQPASSGSSSLYITFGAYGAGAKPIIRNCLISGRSYIKIQGVQFSGTTADYPLLITTGASYNWVDNCEIYAESTGTSYGVARIYMNSHHNKITNSIMAHRNLTIQTDVLGLKYNANYNLIQGNTIGTATHYAVAVEGSSATYPTYTCSYNIIRNNTIQNTQGAQLSIIATSNRNLIEGNTIVGGKSSANTNNAAHSLKNVSSYNIVRFNIVRDNTDANSWGLSSVAYQYNTDPPNNVIGNRVYNNVIANINNNAAVLDNYNPTSSVVNDNTYKNNIFYNSGYSNGLQFTITQYVTGSTNFYNNIFYKSGVTNVISRSKINYSVPGYQTYDPSEAKGNIQADPLLDSNYHPSSGSPAINGGTWLTTVASNSGSGTSFVVADAGYFMDGFGMAQGDTIKVGNASAIITSVNYSTNTITVDRTISWSNGEPVSLPYSGTQPSIGAFDVSVISPPTNLVVTN